MYASSPLAVPGATLFEDFFGLTADAETHRKAEFLSEFRTEKASVVYQTTIAGPKVDFQVAAEFSPEGVQSGFPVLPEAGDFESRFSESARALVEGERMEVNRVAVGAHFVQLVTDKNEGYQRLSQLIPGIRLDASCSDFQYRINRPKAVPYGDQEVHFNRLSTWGCISLRLDISVPGGMGSQAQIGSVVSVNTDVNTIVEQSFSRFPKVVRMGIIERLFLLSKEIPQNGDLS